MRGSFRLAAPLARALLRLLEDAREPLQAGGAGPDRLQREPRARRVLQTADCHVEGRLGLRHVDEQRDRVSRLVALLGLTP